MSPVYTQPVIGVDSVVLPTRPNSLISRLLECQFLVPDSLVLTQALPFNSVQRCANSQWFKSL